MACGPPPSALRTGGPEPARQQESAAARCAKLHRPLPVPAMSMELLRLYPRVLSLLGPEGRLGWILALGNLALAVAQFAEPVLFGRIIDALAGAERAGTQAPAATVAVLMAAWAGFGLFSIITGVSVALHAD